MIRFSASPAAGQGKVFYKNYREMTVDDMAAFGEVAAVESVSSYIYGPGTTDGGEECEGHKAGESIIAAGNVMLFDFDQAEGRSITLDALRDRLSAVQAWIGPSKSWSSELGKLHVAVLIDRDLPLDKDEFELWHCAVAQYLGIEHAHDPCMKIWSQQLAPGGVKDDMPGEVTGGKPLDMADVMACYVAPESGTTAAASDKGVAGFVDDDTVFTLSSDGKRYSTSEILGMVKGGKKVRVHCLAGLEHDGRADTALVRGGEGGVAYYHCSGGRCNEVMVIRDPQPFEEEPGEERVAAVNRREGTFTDALVGLDDVIMDIPHHCGAFEPKASIKSKVLAVAGGLRRVSQLRDMRVIHDEIHAFDGVVWSPAFKGNDLLRWIQQGFVEAGFPAMGDEHAAIKGVAALLRDTLPNAEQPEQVSYLNLQNGMLDLKAMKLLPHDREQLFTSALPFSYNPTAIAPEWEKIVDRVMLGSPELIESLQDAFGYIFARGVFLEVMVGLVGEGANGKSTVIEVLQKLVGKEGASNLPLHILTKPSGEGLYARAGLVGKMVNFTSELSPSALMSSEFKEIISGVHINARHPYGRQFEIPVIPKMVCAMNTTGGLIKEKTHGFIRRLHLIPFAYTLKDEHKDPFLMEKLEAELPGILNWVLVGTARVIANHGLKKAPEMDKLMDQVKRDSNPVQQFLEECCEQHKMPISEVLPKGKRLGMVTPVGEMYANYLRFSEENHYKTLGRNDFSREIVRLGNEKYGESVKMKGTTHFLSGFYMKCLPRDKWKDPVNGRHLTLVKT